MQNEQSIEQMLAAIKTTPAPQSLSDIKPRQQPPSGKTAMEMIQGQWPGEETVEELLEQLEALG